MARLTLFMKLVELLCVYVSKSLYRATDSTRVEASDLSSANAISAYVKADATRVVWTEVSTNEVGIFRSQFAETSTEIYEIIFVFNLFKTPNTARPSISSVRHLHDGLRTATRTNTVTVFVNSLLLQ